MSSPAQRMTKTTQQDNGKSIGMKISNHN